MKSSRKKVTIHEAKTHLSRLLKQVEGGAEIVISNAGRPVARLVAFEPPLQKRNLGRDRDAIWVASDFDAPLPADLLRDFES